MADNRGAKVVTFNGGPGANPIGSSVQGLLCAIPVTCHRGSSKANKSAPAWVNFT
jgi:hypothetical protein